MLESQNENKETKHSAGQTTSVGKEGVKCFQLDIFNMWQSLHVGPKHLTCCNEQEMHIRLEIVDRQQREIKGRRGRGEAVGADRSTGKRSKGERGEEGREGGGRERDGEKLLPVTVSVFQIVIEQLSFWAYIVVLTSLVTQNLALLEFDIIAEKSQTQKQIHF